MTVRKIKGTLKLDLVNTGSGKPVNCEQLAKALTRGLAPPAVAAVFREIATALRSGTGQLAVKVDLPVTTADEVRTAIIGVYNAEVDARRAAADLAYLRRAWELASDFANRPLAGARAAPRPVR
jgi:hypothetical protein